MLMLARRYVMMPNCSSSNARQKLPLSQRQYSSVGNSKNEPDECQAQYCSVYSQLDVLDGILHCVELSYFDLDDEAIRKPVSMGLWYGMTQITLASRLEYHVISPLL